MVRRLWLPLFLAGCASQNQAADLTPSAPGKATLIVSINQPSPQSSLDLSLFDAARQKITGSVLGGFVSFDLSSVSDRGFVWRQVDAGTYALTSYTHQNQWDLCFTEATRSFTVAPGQKLYLGNLDAVPFGSALQARALANGDRAIPHGAVRSYFVAIPPGWSDGLPVPQDDAHVLRVSSTLSVQGVETAVLAPATFKAGYTLTGQRVCGGYFRS